VYVQALAAKDCRAVLCSGYQPPATSRDLSGIVVKGSGLYRNKTTDNRLKKRDGKKIRQTLCIFGVILIVGALAGAAYFTHQKSEPKTWREALRAYMGAPEYESVTRDKPLSEQTSIFEIAGRTFEMPKVYIQTNLGGKRVLPDGINLLYVLPDFTSRADFSTREDYEQAKHDGRFAHMLIEPEARRPSFDVMIANLRHHLTKEEYIGVHDGLEYYKWYHGKPEAPVYYSDIYLEKDSTGRILSFIECAPLERPVRVPHCFHKFRDKALLYHVAYHKENFFSTWKDQRRKAIAFIDSFERSASLQPTKEN
jgi:hypothetical protein